MKVITLALVALATQGHIESVGVQVLPEPPLIEQTRFGQAINFDFELRNNTETILELIAINLAVRDAGGAIIQRLETNDHGLSPSIHTVPKRQWNPGETHIVFNPFHTVSGDISIGRLEYIFSFRNADGNVIRARVETRPTVYRQKTRLLLPVLGRILVWDGHDFLSHHRRFDFTNPSMAEYGRITGNSSRYSYDFVVVDADGKFHRGSGSKSEDHFSYGHSVLAPAAGIVVRAVGSAPDRPAMQEVGPTKEGAAKDLFLEAGNFVVIDHGNGEFSQFGHFKQGTVRVKAGDKVDAGQIIAEAGESGSSMFPHVHYQLTSGPNADSEGLPVVFDNVSRVIGERKLPAGRTWIDSGDIVESILPSAR